MTTPALLLLLLGLTFPSASAAQRRSQFTRYRSWNTRTYPVWRDGDPRFRNCWFGGEVTFDIKGDGPTLTGARTTFTINLNFPPNQTALSDGQVVWARNCTINGQQYEEGQAVYPDQDTAQTGLFPDGTPFTRSQDRKPRYVFVWKTMGRYWQVADGPSSSLTIGTDNVPLGSYNMEVVIYHCRGKDKFVPLGYASSVFSITDQVPFTISLAQVNDINQNDQSFIQNRAIAFSIKLHDPSQYLSNADVSFSWDFGDSSGTLISREKTVTHTYLAVGTFKPQVVLMASVPAGCDNPTAVAPVVASAAPAVIVIGPSAAAPAEAGEAVEVVPVAPAGVDTAVVPEETDAATDPAAADAAAAAAAAADADTDAAADAAAADAAAADAAAADAAAADTDTAADVAAADTDAAADAAAADTDAADTDAAADAAAADTDAAADAAAVDAAAADVAADDTDAAADAAAADAAAANAAAADAAAADVAAADAAAADAAVAEEPVVETDAAEEIVPVIDAAASVAPVAEGEVVDVAADVAVAPVAEEEAVEAEGVAADADAAVVDAAAAEVVPAETVAPAENVIVPVATEATAAEEAAPADVAADPEAEVQETENEVAATVAAAEQPAVEEEAIPAEGEVQAEVEADPAQVPLVVAKRQAPELGADCMIYRYGSLATSVEVVQGIESVEIVQVSNVVAMATALDQNAVDVTISCQGSLPSEVCTVISDADCITPVETVCNAATPSPDCQMILRQFFNDTGVFCLNVSLTNGVSLAVASARVSVSVASGGSPAGTAATVLGVMVLACVVCCIGLMYRRFKQYQPLREDSSSGSVVTSVPLLLWNLLSRQSPGESRPLLQGRVV